MRISDWSSDVCSSDLLHSKVLDYRDIGPLIGLSPPAEVPAPQTKQADTAPPAAVKTPPSKPAPAPAPAGDAPPPRVLPDAPLAAEPIRAVDGKVPFHGDKVDAPNENGRAAVRERGWE